MKLWSFQSPTFSLVDGEVRPEKSQFARDYRVAYQGLWDRVGTDQLIWCCTSADDWPMKTGYCQWDLEVPDNRIFRIIDGMVWAGIRGDSYALTPRLRGQLLEQHYNGFLAILMPLTDGWTVKL